MFLLNFRPFQVAVAMDKFYATAPSCPKALHGFVTYYRSYLAFIASRQTRGTVHVLKAQFLNLRPQHFCI